MPMSISKKRNNGKLVSFTHEHRQTVNNNIIYNNNYIINEKNLKFHVQLSRTHLVDL